MNQHTNKLQSTGLLVGLLALMCLSNIKRLARLHRDVEKEAVEHK